MAALSPQRLDMERRLVIIEVSNEPWNLAGMKPWNDAERLRTHIGRRSRAAIILINER